MARAVKTQKKQTAKTERTRKPKVVEQFVDSPSPKQKKSSLLGSKKKYIIFLLILIVVAGFLYFFKSLFIAALVNGEPISRLTLVRELEKQAGQQALNQLVTKTLILQQARKENVIVSDQEINDEIKKVEGNLSKQGQTLEQLLTARSWTRADLAEQVRIQKLIEKMVGHDIVVSSDDINKYIETNKSMFPEGTASAQMKDTIKEDIRQQKLSEKFQPWLEKLQKDAKTTYFVTF